MVILEIATIPIIVTCVYGIVEYLKVLWFNKKPEHKKFIPIVAAGIGAILGLILFFIEPTLVPMKGWYGGIIAGAASGLSAVGINQIGKQFVKDKDVKQESDEVKKE